ncbi:MFS-type transporter dbaD [Pseudocercospora fuligena]|uniref:MFS-type transporter dbaD n=1 Tax=Pseudocercospora fuligena TaxID=685502 RepID=A0A8H6RNR6_9PEZI|nr:MFS-type transporter dbaD [Pseudocercospora fuligena]
MGKDSTAVRTPVNPSHESESASPKWSATKASINEEKATSGKPNQEDDSTLIACYHVLGSFCLLMNSWGIINTFGVYQTFYEAELFAGQKSSSDISWIGSIQAFALIFVGVITGPLFDRGYFGSQIVGGSFLVVFGMMTLSLCSEYWQVMLSQGLVVGLGSGLLFLPSVAVLPMYFTKKRALAQGIAASGSSIGGVVYPIIFHRLQPKIGFGWATRVIAFIALVTLLASFGMKQKTVPPTVRKMLDWNAFKEPGFNFFLGAYFFGCVGIYIPFYYIGVYSLDRDVAASLAFYLVAILNASSTFGRILPNLIADSTGPLNMMIPCNAICAVLVFSWIAINGEAGLIVFAIFYGFFSGCFVSLPPVVVVKMSPSLGIVGTRLGMNLVFGAFGILVGNPVAGAILGARGDAMNWIGLMAWTGGCIIIATACMVGARVCQVGWGLRKAA